MRGNGYPIAAAQKRERLAQGLGWFSIGLGLAEVLMPRTLANLIGARPRPGLLRALGARELLSGIGILTSSQPAPWLKARVAGDAMDLALLGAALFAPQAKRGKLAFATANVAAVTALDVLASQEFSYAGQHDTERRTSRWTRRLERSLIINRAPEELYQFWRRFEELPRFMGHLISVRQTGDNLWHWAAKGPAGTQVEWDARIIEDKPNELISWQSLENADVDNAGSVRFERAPGDRGTIVRVKMQYRPPAGKTGALVAKMLGQAPEKQIAVDLLRFKQMMETGEIARTEGQPAGRQRSTSVKFDEPVRA